jgi:hypothetical protein
MNVQQHNTKGSRKAHFVSSNERIPSKCLVVTKLTSPDNSKVPAQQGNNQSVKPCCNINLTIQGTSYSYPSHIGPYSLSKNSVKDIFRDLPCLTGACPKKKHHPTVGFQRLDSRDPCALQGYSNLCRDKMISQAAFVWNFLLALGIWKDGLA